MNIKSYFEKIKAKTLTIWDKGFVQKTSRITYDVSANLLLFFVVIIGMVFLFAGGAGAGYFASLVKDEPLRSYEDMQRDIYNYEETSKLFFADNKYIGDVRSELHREEIDLKDVSDNVTKAVIATEDQLFYEHNGIVPKAIVRALYQDILSSGAQTGGSTLTQQLIKNQILTNEVSFERKAKEMLLAMRLENFFEKDEILEAYLNVIPYGRNSSGRNIAGIQTAAQGVFGVDASELNIPQAAYLSGIPQNPYAHTPFLNSGEVKKDESLQLGLSRMETVLKRMYQSEFISDEEYEDALRYDIVDDFVDTKDTAMEKYAAIVFQLQERAEEIIIEVLANEDGYIMDDLEEDDDLFEQYEILAKRALRMNGYNIHSTIDKKMYDEMQKVVANYEYYGPSKTVSEENEDGKTVQVTEEIENGVVLIENKTGRILSFSPGRDYSIGTNQFNYATQAYRSPGSTFKPLTYASGMDMGVIQPGSVVADILTKYNIPGQKPYTPGNYQSSSFYGLVSIREALAQSYNVSAVRTYVDHVAGTNIGEKYLDKLKFEHIIKEDYSGYSFPLGGVDKGVSVEENTNVFSIFSNEGKYIPSYMIEKITTNDDEVIYEHEVEPVEIFSTQTAFLTFDIMRDVISSGTASYIPTQLNNNSVDWAGKTGTSQYHHDGWFVGTNPNVTMGSWIGYDTRSSIKCTGCSLTYHQRNMKLWGQIINKMAEINPELITPKERLKQPDGLVNRSYCAVSGMLPSKICKEAGLIRSDLFNAKFVPTKEDDSLIGGDMPLVMVDGDTMVAGPETPEEFTIEGEEGGIAFNPDFIKRMGYDKELDDLSELFPRRNRELWEKIGFDGTSLKEDEKDKKKKAGKPSKPKKLKLDEDDHKLTWDYKKGEMIVGYRIYYAPKTGGTFKALDHTIEPTYTLSEAEGVYHIKSVNYYGEESEPSASVTVEVEEEEEESDEKDDSNDDDSQSNNSNNDNNGNNGNNNGNKNNNDNDSGKNNGNNNDKNNNGNGNGENNDNNGNGNEENNDNNDN